MSFRKVAEMLGISTQAVIRRYNRLKKNVLSYSSITVNLEKLGYRLCWPWSKDIWTSQHIGRL
jgi:DNA-binding Lrp family transcriptional regulator